MNTSQKEHDQILARIKKRNYGQAKRALRSHINKFVAFIEDKIGERGKAREMEPEQPGLSSPKREV